MAAHMPDNGFQVVMFTHQDVGVWADLAEILWASGLQVTAGWCIATVTEPATRVGNFGDADYQLAAYAAALEVLTRYSVIDNRLIAAEALRERGSVKCRKLRASCTGQFALLRTSSCPRGWRGRPGMS